MSRPRHTDRELQKEVGARLATVRKARGWSQERLAEALGVQPETISRYETGTVPMSLAVLVRIGDLVQVPIADLLPLDENGRVDHGQAQLLRAWELLDDEARSAVLVLVGKMVAR